MKRIYLFAAVAALFAACSSEDVAVNEQQKQDQTEVANSPIGFDVYTQKATTRGGTNGSITTDVLKGTSSAVGPGFGVFGYYTDNNEYDQRSTPNFMYNQQVTAKFNGSTFDSWEYKPIVYWPNEYGSNANSDDQDKVTFFAYAPYIKVIPTSGKLADTSNDAEEWGITGMTRNSNQGDPILKYIAQFRADRSVDLCWGVADNEDGYKWMTTQDGVAQQRIENGTPWLNLYRPADAAGQKVKFTFKHALAQMRINIDAEIDEIRGDNVYYTPNKTRVWVREVTFKGFALKGALNLNNSEANTAKWLDYNGQNELVAEDVIVYDGRKDGKEGVNGAVATNEKLTGLNPAIVQDGIYEGANSPADPYEKGYEIVVNGVNPDPGTYSAEYYKRTGVPGTPIPLFAQDATNQNIAASDKLFHVIPTDDNFEIEIVYDIETVSKNLAQNLSDGATKGSSIENRIRKTVNFGDATKLEAGKSYTVNLHLGLNSVKFDAEVGEWINETPQDVDLPLNAPIYAASTTTSGPGSEGTPYAVELPYTGNYTFAIKGLNGGESVAYAADGTTKIDGWTCSPVNNALSNGYALEELTTNVNPTTLKRTHKASWKGNQSGYQTYFEFTQAAHPLFLTGTGAVDGTTITLTRHNNAEHSGSSSDWTGTGGVNTGWWTDATGVADSKYIKVWRNGVELTHITSGDVGNSQFLFTDTGDANKKDATITIKDKLKNGDIIKVTLKTGDAPEETISFKIGS